MNTDPEIWRQISDLTEAGHLIMARVETIEAVLVATMGNGRELWMDNDGDIWHHHDGRMYPLTDEGEHVNVRDMRGRARRVGSVMGMQRHEAFPTLQQLADDQGGLLVRVTELDVVKRHVRKLEARLAELES